MKRFRLFLEALNKVPGTQDGSNPGGIHVDSETGEKHYVKHYANANHAKTEALASKIYKHLGVHGLDHKYGMINGKHSVSSKWNEHLESMHPHDFEHLSKEQAHQIGKHYHAAVLTKNWDAVGMNHDNISRHKKTGNLHVNDLGSAFQFRAQGSHKDYGPDIDEIRSLRKEGRPTGHVFNTVFKQHPDAEHAGVEAVRNMDDKHIHNLFKKSGLPNHEELHANFMERKKKLLAHYDK